MKRFCICSIAILTVLLLIFASCKGKEVSVAPGDKDLIVVTTVEPRYFNNLADAQTDIYDCLVYSQVYDPLFFKDWNRGGEVRGYLAESFEISADGRQIRVKLRDNIYFHNGYKLTSEDVQFSFDTLSTKPVGIALLINYNGVEIIDELNFIIHLSNPFAAIMNALCSRVGFISSKRYWNDVGGYDGYAAHPIGTGPYKFVSALSGNEIVMERNDDYWNGRAAFKGAIVRIVADVNTAVLAIENGDADVAMNLPIDSLINIRNPDVVWDANPDITNGNWRFNFMPTNWVSQDINFRRAIQRAINKDALNEGVFYGKTRTNDIMGDESWTGRPPAGTYNTYTYNPEEARQLLRASNYDGREMRVVTWSGTNSEKAAQIIQANLQEVGINMRIVAVDRPTFWDIVRGTGEFEVKFQPGGASTIDMDGYNYFLFNMYEQPSEVFPYGQEMNDLILAGRIEMDPERRIEIYRRLINIINDNAIMISTYQELNTILYRKEMKNVVAETAVPQFRFFDWSY